MIAGTLRWILQHQNHDRNSYFARSPVKNTKTTGEIKAAAVKKYVCFLLLAFLFCCIIQFHIYPPITRKRSKRYDELA